MFAQDMTAEAALIRGCMQHGGYCPMCKGEIEVENFDSLKSKQEFAISGMCQKCQDLLFNPKCEHGVEVYKVECFECAYEDES